MNAGIIIIPVSVIWLASEIILSRTKRSHSSDRRIDKSSLRILWITIAASVNLGVLLAFQRIGSLGNESQILQSAGIALIICGLIVRWLAILSLKDRFTVDVAITKGHRIVRDGLYRFVRHPAYLGSLLSFLGLGMFFSNYLSIAVIFVPICLAFLYRIRIEESVLAATFGDEYLAYCASTKRLIPGIF